MLGWVDAETLPYRNSPRIVKAVRHTGHATALAAETAAMSFALCNRRPFFKE